MAFSSVDLPQPDGPSSTMNSPSPMSRSSSFTTVRLPKATEMPRSATLAMPQPFTAPAAMPRTNQRPETK